MMFNKQLKGWKIRAYIRAVKWQKKSLEITYHISEERLLRPTEWSLSNANYSS